MVAHAELWSGGEQVLVRGGMTECLIWIPSAVNIHSRFMIVGTQHPLLVKAEFRYIPYGRLYQ